jgi:transposase InsO family protein
MVLVDAAGIHFEVSLLSTRNIVFAKLLAILIKFRTHNPDFPVKTLRMDNAAEFKSQHFEDYCLATGIELTYSVPYKHSQNGLAEAFIKKIQLISRPLLIQAGLPSYFWAHVVLDAATLLRYRPTLLNDFSPLDFLSDQKHDISHFRVFGCQVWIPTVEPKRTTISKHRIEGVYVGFDSPSIIRYLTPSTGIMHKARF